MADEMGERPLGEIRTGQAEFGIYQVLLEQLEDKDDTKSQEVLARAKEAKNALDLGSGSGESIKSLKENSPQLEIIDAVDRLMKPAENALKTVNPTEVTHYEQYINQFLSTPPHRYDLVVMSGVPDHNIKSETQYQKLADAIRDGGILVETGDTNLTEKEMQRHFDKILETKYSALFVSNRIWQKKAGE